MQQKLQKPVFCKVADLKPGKHCYNIYCKVLKVNAIEITKFNVEVVRIADGVVGDETVLQTLDWLEKMWIKWKKAQFVASEMGDLR